MLGRVTLLTSGVNAYPNSLILLFFCNWAWLVRVIIWFCFPYQVERKRHIGNDIVIIVFQDEDEKLSSFSPPTIKSKFVRIFYWFYCKFNRPSPSCLFPLSQNESSRNNAFRLAYSLKQDEYVYLICMNVYLTCCKCVCGETDRIYNFHISRWRILNLRNVNGILWRYLLLQFLTAFQDIYALVSYSKSDDSYR